MKRLVIVALGMSLGACLSHPPPPPAPYHAVGQGAAWTLIIDDRYLTFIPAPGQQPILQPSVKPIVGFAGEIYQTPRFRPFATPSASSAGPWAAERGYAVARGGSASACPRAP